MISKKKDSYEGCLFFLSSKIFGVAKKVWSKYENREGKNKFFPKRIESAYKNLREL